MIYGYLVCGIICIVSIMFALSSFYVARKEKEARRKKEKEDAEKIMRLERENSFLELQQEARKNAEKKANEKKKKINSGSDADRVSAAASIFGLQDGGSKG